MKTTKEPVKATIKKKDNKFRVIPNLSLKGKDIMKRVKNRSLQLTPQMTYSLESEYDDFRRMNKLDQVNRYNEVRKQKDQLTKQLQKHGNKV